MSKLLEKHLPKKPVKMDETKDMRYSLEIDEDLRRPLEARAKKVLAVNSASQRTVNLGEDTMYEAGDLEHLDDGDDSFSAFERMCDKTGSDPDSTLFQYLHSEDRSQVMARARDHSTDDQKEIDALRRMLEAVGTEDDLLENESPVKGAECTHLEDIEAPSRFWDNTLAGMDETSSDSGLTPKALTKVSPVKMVGLLRPSTIIEDSELESSDVSSHTSFQSARTLKTNASSSYETATDTSLSGTLLNVDELFYAAIAKAKPPGMSKGEELELLSDLHGSLRELASLPKDEVEEEEDDIEDTIIELSSSDDEEVQLVPEVKQEDTSRVSSVHGKDHTEQKPAEKSVENKENSLHFNDTMEEMEYMMQKGMEYMAGGAPSVAAVKADCPVLPKTKQSTFVVSPKPEPKSPAVAFLQPSIPLRSSNQPQTVVGSSSTGRKPLNVGLTMEWTKKKFFSAASGIPQRRQNQIKQPYANIVSPIRTYTQKSGTAPLMSTFRPTSSDMLSTLAISELEQESRLCHPKALFATKDETPKSSEAESLIINGIDSAADLLPKKAYISSEIKHVVDERTPLPMPKVPQIQKYLNSAVEPTVMRHDGKMKMPGEAVRNPSSSHIPRRANHSLADLSLASGDVSLYTIRDAQKF
uniref:Septin interacting protein 2, isoform C n=2 Tax=Drosophila melanogaster TaxID=7227 RepID=Q7KTL4_DROME|eukprot:NP_723235.2 septin interacting protein 2, isoform C [Drosophila melanogaster]